DGVGLAQVVDVEPVARRQALVHQQTGGGALLGNHAAVAGGGGRPHRAGRPAQRHLGGGRQGAEAHARDRDRDGELQRLAGVPGAEDGAGVALLPVALERVPGQRGGQEQQVVEGGQVPLGAPAPDLVVTFGRGALNLRDHLGREGAAPAVCVHGQAVAAAVAVAFHQCLWSVSISDL